MTHQDWITAIATAIAAAVGGLAGGWLALIAADRTNTEARALAQQDRDAQAQLSREQQNAALKAAADERDRIRREQREAIARSAAVGLLDRIGDLDEVLAMVNFYRGGARPPFGRVGTDEDRQRTHDGVDSFRRGLRTELLLVTDAEVVRRVRTLARLVSELQSDLGEKVVVNRALVDVTNYMKYVIITLQRFIDAQELPAEAEPPVLIRNMADGSTWTPQEIPDDWDRI